LHSHLSSSQVWSTRFDFIALCLDHFVCVRFICFDFHCTCSTLYYCNTVRWALWEWELTTLLQRFDTAGWVIRPVKYRLRNDLNCVEWDVKPCSISHSVVLAEWIKGSRQVDRLRKSDDHSLAVVVQCFYKLH